MTDIWDEKPPQRKWHSDQGEIPTHFCYPSRVMDAWLDKVGRFIGNLEQDIADLKETIRNMDAQEKAYVSCIDELKEKAEKWDNYLESIKDSIPHVSLADYEVLGDKLEAIKTYIKAQANSTTPAYAICVGVLSILEG